MHKRLHTIILLVTLSCLTVVSPYSLQHCRSLPDSPYVHRRRKSFSRTSIRIARHLRHQMEHQPLVDHQLEGLNLPYADDSTAVTPCSEDIGILNTHSKFSFLTARKEKMMRGSDSRRESNASNSSFKHHPPSPSDKLSKLSEQFERNKAAQHHLQPGGITLDKGHDDTVSRNYFVLAFCFMLSCVSWIGYSVFT